MEHVCYVPANQAPTYIQHCTARHIAAPHYTALLSSTVPVQHSPPIAHWCRLPARLGQWEVGPRPIGGCRMPQPRPANPPSPLSASRVVKAALSIRLGSSRRCAWSRLETKAGHLPCGAVSTIPMIPIPCLTRSRPLTYIPYILEADRRRRRRLGLAYSRCTCSS